MRTVLFGMISLLITSGCDPRFVDSKEQVDGFLAHNRLSAVCVALKNDQDDALREYSARKLAPNKDSEVATSCLCESIYNPEFQSFDASIARGLKGTNRGDLAKCLMPALDKKDRKEDEIVLAVNLIAGIGGDETYTAMVNLLKTSDSGATREAAARALTKPRDNYQDLLLDRLANDEHAPVRAAVADIFGGSKDEAVVAGLLRALEEDKDGGVRAAALKSVVKLRLDQTDAMVCSAMIDDPDERVRDRAVRSFRGSKRSKAIQCLKKRLLTKEDSTVVRASTLEALGRSPSDEAALVLCNSIGPFLRMYVVDGIAESLPAVNIIETQNNRDFERSYECVQKAIRQGGYSCYARNHLGTWMNELGGKASTPWCPGMTKNVQE